jgi:hypothetical protein
MILLVVMLVTGGIASVWQDTIAAQSNEASLPDDVGDLSNATTIRRIV